MDIAESVDAKKLRLGEADALRLAAGADVIYSMRGQKVVQLDLKGDKPSRADILSAMLGPTGNLRAPVLRRGRSLFVGFSEGVLKKHLG